MKKWKVQARDRVLKDVDFDFLMINSQDTLNVSPDVRQLIVKQLERDS